MTYSQQLRDPRWQKKRTDIMDRDQWRCRHCDAAHKPLHVHHLYYDKGHSPWAYPDWSLLTLCEDCHAEEERNKTNADWRMIASLRALGADNKAMDRMALMFEELARLAKFPSGALASFEELLDQFWTRRVINKE